MTDQTKTALFETVPIPSAVFKLCIPTVLSSLVMVLYNLADTYFVGQMNDPVQNAAVTLAAPVLLAFNAVNNLFGVGSSSMMSRALGRKDYDTVRKSAAFGFYCAFLAALLFSLGVSLFKYPLTGLLGADEITRNATGDYLFWTVSLGAIPSILNVVMAYLVRAEGSTLHAALGTMSGCLLNILLDPIMILPGWLGMGAAGAGCATFLSNLFACGYYAVMLLARRGKTYVSVNPRDFRPNKQLITGVFGVGIPAMIQNLLNVTGMTVLNNFTSVYGESAVAAMGIAQKLAMIPLQVGLGLGQGIMPLIGYTYAARMGKRMKSGFLFTAVLSMSILLLCASCYYIFSAPLVCSFMKDADVVGYGSRFLKGFALSAPLLCADFLAVGVFQACGMGLKALIFAFLRKVVLEIPALFILNALVPLYGLAYAQLCAESILTVAAVFMLRRIFRSMPSDEVTV